MTRSSAPSIALVGCGAIAQAFYLPAIAKLREKFDDVWLVDPSGRALAGAAAIMPGKQARRFADVSADVRLVIVATPNHLHHPVALEAISRGSHVLVEKPFVIYPADGRALCDAATTADRLIAINQTRRLYPLARDLRRRIREGEFGSLTSITHREGTKLSWPFESGAGFAVGANRTGVIMDFGVHVMDFYQYLFEPRWTLVSAVHDGFSGPEGLAEIELQADNAPVSIRLSRYYSQENVAHLRFDNAEISFQVYDDSSYSVRSLRTKQLGASKVVLNAENNSAAERLLLNFLAACEGREPAVCDAASSLPVIDILDKLYREAGRYPDALGST